MTRRIITTNYHATPDTTARIDGYFDRILKYIPADVVGAWIAVSGIISTAPVASRGVALWSSFIFGIAFTVVWTWRQTSGAKSPPAVTQIALSTAAFIVWVFAFGGPFQTLDWYQPFEGSLALIGFTLVSGLVIPGEG